MGRPGCGSEDEEEGGDGLFRSSFPRCAAFLPRPPSIIYTHELFSFPPSISVGSHFSALFKISLLKYATSVFK